MTVAAPLALPARSARPSILGAGLVFLTGVFTVLSLPLVGDSAQSVRVLDLLGVVSLLSLASLAWRRRWPARVWLVLWISGIGVLLVLIDALQDGDNGRVNILARLVLSAATGIFLARMATERARVGTLALGIWSGAVAGCVIAFGQSAGVGFLLDLAPADRLSSSIDGTLRPSAIWGHPNAAAQATMAGAAAILLVWTRREGVVLLPLALYAVVPVLNYAIMQNRGPLVVGLLICLVLTARQAQVRLRIAALLCGAGVVSILVFDPQSLIGERWTGTFSGLSTAEQVAERIRSTAAGLAIAFEEPLGHALAEREQRMLAETGTRASHNGFVFAALVIGPWLTAFLLGALVIAVGSAGLPGSGRRCGLAIGSIGAMLLFEDAIFEPTITTLLVLVASLAVLEKPPPARPAAWAGAWADTGG